MKEFMPFERELNFTKAFKKHINSDKATREYHCLKEQIPQSFLTLKNKDSDIFAGRISDARVGFYTLFAGNDGIDKCGYCIREDLSRKELEALIQSEAYEESYLNEIKEMLAFWHDRYTVTKIRDNYSDDMIRSFPDDYDYHVKTSAIYPLYRIAGVNLDFKKLLSHGLPGLIELIESKLPTAKDDKSKALYESMIGSVRILKSVCKMYESEIGRLAEECLDVDRKNELLLMQESLGNIQRSKPKTLHEAIQLITLYMLATGSREMGRIDNYLGEFYTRDKEAGRITREDALRMLICFFDIIEEELIRDTRAIIGGVGRGNVEAADEFALLVLDTIEMRPLNYLPQISVRWHKNLNTRIFERSLEILAGGSTFPMFYNDEVNVPAVMRAMDVTRNVAEQYTFFGCGEYILEGKSIGTPNALINMAKVLELTLNNGVDPVTGKFIGLKTGEVKDLTTFEVLVENYWKQMQYGVDLAGKFKELVYEGCNQDGSFLLVSILMDDCIERGKSIFDGGLYHLGGTIETYGNITTADSLAAIKEVVFKQKKFSISKLVEMVQADFDGYEHERSLLKNAPKFGNDNEIADEMAIMVHEGICNMIRNQRNKIKLDSLLAVVINNGTNVGMGQKTGATPDGRKAFVPLSNANSAFNGCDREGVTALIKSMTKLDTSIHAGANQNIKLSPNLFGKNKVVGKQLLNSFFELGGQQTNLTVVNQKDLEDAMIHPENHENLLVRVGGYTARFVTLDKDIQKDILKRTAY